MPPFPVTELRASSRVRSPGATVTPYDFRHPTKLSREHARALQMAYETFAGRLTTLLTSGLRQVCRVTVGDLVQQSYDEYVGGLPVPSLLVPVEAAPLGTGALGLSLPVALAAIDHMLGGPGGNQPTRTLTDIETSIFRRLVDQIFGVLQYALEPIKPMTLTPGEIEYNPQFLQVAGASDAVVVGHFDLVIGQQQCLLTVCLPLAPLLPALTVHRPRDVAAGGLPAGAHPHVRERLAELSVDVHVRFAPVAVDSSIVLGLQVGDIVSLGHRVGAPLDVLAGGTRVAQAIAGRSGTMLAALLVDPSTQPVKEFR